MLLLTDNDQPLQIITYTIIAMDKLDAKKSLIQSQAKAGESTLLVNFNIVL